MKDDDGVIVFSDVVRLKCCFDDKLDIPSKDTLGLSGYLRFVAGRPFRIGGNEVDAVNRIAWGLVVFGGEHEKVTGSGSAGMTVMVVCVCVRV